MSSEPVRLRDVEEGDFEIFFEHQLDPEAVAMAAFPSRDHEAHIAHWRKISADDACITKAIVVGDTVAGNIGSWSQDGHQEVGYWIGKEHWGKGIASEALALLLKEVAVRPIYAVVISSNAASIRVLEKAGFVFERMDGPQRVYRVDG